MASRIRCCAVRPLSPIWRNNNLRYTFFEANDGGYELKYFETELRALLRDEVIAAVERAGYKDAHWHVPEESGYYQPIVTARNQ